MGFSNQSIEKLKEQINIIDVVGRCVPLKRAGSNYKGVCPFHSEKTPSFVVSEQKQIFTCFGCGASGDVIAFVEKYYNLDFTEAVEKIAGEYGIQLEKSTYGDNRDVYYQVNRLAANYFYRAFTERANKGYAYMKRRGISPAVLKKFGIGYADEQWDSLYRYLLAQGVEKKIILELGLAAESKGKCYDKFRNRVMFPIINTSGKVIGFGGRAIDSSDGPKYLNSPESRIFQKKNNLYGLNIARQSAGKTGYLILVEGYMDVISLYQSGIENISASLGTALTENQAKLIKRYTKNVILSYDADGAGRAAALRGIEILKKEDCRVKVLHVSEGKDPDEYIKKNGKAAFLELVENALPYADYKLESAKLGIDLETDEGRIEYSKKAVAILEELSPVEREVYIKKLAREMSVPEAAIRMELSDAGEPERHPERRNRQPDVSRENTEVSPVERTLLKLILTEESYIDRIAQIPDILQSEFASAVWRLAADEYHQNRFVDQNRILDSLSEQDAALLQEIIDQVIVSGNEEQVFADCVRTWKKNLLAQEEQRLILQLSLADEENNQKRIEELTDQLMDIQKKMKIEL